MNVMPREEVLAMLHEWKQEVDLRATGATCPMPKCAALVITYEPAESLNAITGAAAPGEFVCSECGCEFSATPNDLLFRSVPREWLFSAVSHA